MFPQISVYKLLQNTLHYNYKICVIINNKCHYFFFNLLNVQWLALYSTIALGDFSRTLTIYRLVVAETPSK